MVVVRLADGSESELAPGDIVGRASSAALQLDDPGVSEAHAFVSHRGHGLCLQALRGTLSRDGRPVDEVVLQPGVRVELTPETWFEVIRAEAPDPDPITATAGPEPPLTLRVLHEGVEFVGPHGSVWVRGREGLLIGEILREGEPVHWTRIARRVWPRAAGEDPEGWRRAVRKRWDMTLRRIRDRLREHGLADPIDHRGGIVAPVKRPGDAIEIAD